MEQRVHLITAAVPDVAVARAFYLDGLGWSASVDLPEILFLQVGHGILLGLFGADDLAADIGAGVVVIPGSGFTLAHNVGSAEEVDAVMATAAGAGATILKPGQKADFGGYHGYFRAPDGVLWEVAYNPGLVFDAEGRAVFDQVLP